MADGLLYIVDCLGTGKAMELRVMSNWRAIGTRRPFEIVYVGLV